MKSAPITGGEIAQDGPAAAEFAGKGYLIVRNFLPAERVDALRSVVESALQPLQGPAEFEADVGYKGAPVSRTDAGGQTPRRLLFAYSRHEMFRELATSEELALLLHNVAGANEANQRSLALSQCHHNCIMTKCPGFSSTTLWHQDIRYWSFERPELISAWFALTPETPENGSLRLLPGSHRLDLSPDRFDAEQFLRLDLPENEALINSAASVVLQPGDLLLFHSRTFHAAGKNITDKVKLSAVFTYHDLANKPREGSRSAQLPSITLNRTKQDDVESSGP